MNKDKLLEALNDIEDLDKDKDFILIKQHGGSLQECCLQGSKNGLIHFARQILNIALGSTDEVVTEVIIREDSVAHIDFIEVINGQK